MVISPVSPRESRLAAGIALLIVALWVALAAVHGALGAARNDDWDGYNLAYRFAAQHAFVPSGWLEMTLIGQLWLAWPVVAIFGPQIVPLQLLVAGLAAAGLWASYLLVRELLPRRAALLAVACLAAGPLYGSLAVSFMTDIPACTFQLLALLATQRGLRTSSPSVAWVALALGLALLAFSIRDFSAAVGVTICFVCLQRAPSRERAPLLLLAVAWLVAIVAIYVWRHRLPNTAPRQFGFLVRGGVGYLEMVRRGAFDLALFVLPALLALSPVALVRAAWRRARLPTAIALGLLIVVVAVGWSPSRFLDNYLTPQGSYPMTISGEHPLVVPDSIWSGLGWIALFGLGLLTLVGALTLAPRAPEPSPSPLVATYVTFMTGLHLAILFFSSAPLFDRYLVPLVPLVAALVLQVAWRYELVTRGSRALAIVSLVALAILGLRYVDAVGALDGGRWRLGAKVVALGFEPRSLDGGLAWFGYHNPGRVNPKAPRRTTPFWLDYIEHGPVCARSLLKGGNAQSNVLAEHRERGLFGVEYNLVATVGPQRCQARR